SSRRARFSEYLAALAAEKTAARVLERDARFRRRRRQCSRARRDSRERWTPRAAGCTRNGSRSPAAQRWESVSHMPDSEMPDSPARAGHWPGGGDATAAAAAESRRASAARRARDRYGLVLLLLLATYALGSILPSGSASTAVIVTVQAVTVVVALAASEASHR